MSKKKKRRPAPAQRPAAPTAAQQEAVLSVLHGKLPPDPARARRQERCALAVLLVLALAARSILACLTEGHRYDVSCFLAWGFRMAERGAGGFYAADYFCDYPPGYLWVLGCVGHILRGLKLVWTGKAARFVLTLAPALADCAGAAVVYAAAKPRCGARKALWFAGALAFCPVLLYDTAVWKQIDGVLSLPLLLCFLLLERAAGETVPRAALRLRLGAAALFGAALAVKPQALLAGPVLAFCFLIPALEAADLRGRLRALGVCVLGAACSLGVVAAAGLPFFGLRGLVPGLAGQYFASTTSYPYGSVGAFNFIGALGGNWKAQQGASPFWMSWQTLGTVLLIALTAFVGLLAKRGQRRGRFSPVLLAAVYLTGVFTVSHRMHERYILPGLVLLLCAAAMQDNARLLTLTGGMSFTALLNLAALYTNLDGDDMYLTGAASRLLLRGAGLAETVLFVLAAWEAWRWCGGEKAAPLPLRPAKTFIAPPVPQRRWRLGEVLAVAGLTALTALFSFWRLGDTRAPQTVLDANGGAVQLAVRVEGEASSLWLYPGISSYNSGYVTVTDPQGETVCQEALDYLAPFAWKKLPLPEGSPFYLVEIEDGQIIELAFKDAAGQMLAASAEVIAQTDGVTGTDALCDEPELVPEWINYRNSFYFDEIYHARTAYELLHGMRVYETTHPPLGKVLIAAGIALFGMTAFGWRCMGVLFGVMQVPLLYLLLRRLTRRPALAGFGAALLAFDFMRMSQSRIATIDVYVVFFILLGAYALLWYAQTVLEKGVLHALLPMALGGAAFGMAAAVKWTGFYAGAGFAVLYFGVLAQRYVQTCGADSPLAPAAGRRLFRREVSVALAGGVLFYVLLPLAIYIASYLPYLKYNPGFGVAEWMSAQQSMLRYHAGLEATHPFSSPWYSWIFDLRPVWYYMGRNGGWSSIAGFFNPVVCWCGTAAVLWLLGRALVGRGSPAGGYVLVCWLSGLLPWMLVTRCTFLYHYYPCLPFAIAAVVLWLEQLYARDRVRARLVGAAVLVLAAVCFVWFRPVLTGVTVDRAWAASMQWLPSWGFYIL